VKFLVSQFSHFLGERQMRQNLRALLKYVVFLLAIISLFAVLFHLIMTHVERQEHSWITGFYWTLTVMSTLGFGDITFQSDLGRVFSIVVLLTGIVLLLIVLPFVFIRYFYAPWIEAQVRLQAPRTVPPEMRGHVLLCTHDAIAQGLIDRLRLHDVPYFVLESDPAEAARLYGAGVRVIAGDVENRAAWEAAGVARARMVVANRQDTVNTNITLTVRATAPDVPIAAIVDHEESVDILELSGCTHVLALKQRLGEHLANRVNAGHAQAHVIGRFRDLLIAEFAAHNTPLAGRTIRETRLREALGINVVAVWERGRVLPAAPDTVLTEVSVPVVVGTAEQLQRLDELLVIYDTNYSPVLVIGGGKVGTAAALALKRRGVAFHLVERDVALHDRLAPIADRLIVGDAADRDVIMSAGLAEAPAVLLTTNDDATNIYLAVYCRRLNPELRIVGRITHERNLEAIHRAGVDFALSYASLGVEIIFAALQGRDSVIIGEGVELYAAPLPQSLEGKTLAESTIGARTGLNVIAVQHDGSVITNPPPTTRLAAGSELVMLGTSVQRQAFAESFD
jgi:voltage-gated potassium channel